MTEAEEIIEVLKKRVTKWADALFDARASEPMGDIVTIRSVYRESQRALRAAQRALAKAKRQALNTGGGAE